MTQVGKYSLLFGGVRFKNHAAPAPFASGMPPGDAEYLSDLFLYDSDNVSWHKVSILEATGGEGVNWPCGRYGMALCSQRRTYLLLAGCCVHVLVVCISGRPHCVWN